MSLGQFCKRVSVQADIGGADVKPRSGGRSPNERADVLANQGVLQVQ
jgi:hypothetical protein